MDFWPVWPVQPVHLTRHNPGTKSWPERVKSKTLPGIYAANERCRWRKSEKPLSKNGFVRNVSSGNEMRRAAGQSGRKACKKMERTSEGEKRLCLCSTKRRRTPRIWYIHLLIRLLRWYRMPSFCLSVCLSVCLRVRPLSFSPRSPNEMSFT